MPERWVDFTDVLRDLALRMREIYGLPSAWAGFVLSGYWGFEV